MTATLPEIVAKARAAQAAVCDWSQERVDEMIAAVGWALYRREHAEACARSAIEETTMGLYEDKLVKHRKKTLGTLRDLQGARTVGIIDEDKARGLIKIAKPVGVVGALTPVTNCSSTICCNGLSILKGRNAVIFAPHPSAKRTAELTCGYMRDALRKVGAPEALVQNVAEPSIDLTQQLMKLVDVVVATGGAAMVKAAYSSGTPSYGVGAGNSICVIDETADIRDAAHKIRLSKTFDNATSCSSENSVVIHEDVFQATIDALQAEGGYLCNPAERAKLHAFMWPDGAHLNKQVPGRHAKTIAAGAGLTVPEGTAFLMVRGERIGPEDLFSGEKLSPVLTVWKFAAFREAIAYVQKLTAYSGRGHSCSIHTTRDDRVIELGMQVPVSRMIVRQSQCYANSGDYVNGMPFSLTLGCGTWAGNLTTDNINYRHFLNYTWLSTPIPEKTPTDEEIFGGYLKKWGRD